MAKLTAPLLSLGATGTVAKTITIGSWRGVQYARQRVVPANPRTTAQQSTRTAFSYLNAMWKAMPSLGLAPWDAFARGKALTDRNAFISFNLPNLRSQSDMMNFVGSPGVLSGPAPAQVSVSGGAGTLTIDLIEPTLPQGWVIDAAVGMAVPDQQPTGVFTGSISADEDTTAPYQVQFSGLAAGDYLGVGWFRYVRPDGKTAYSVSIGAIATVS